MYTQSSHEVVGYFRPNRKCISFNGSLLFLLLLTVDIAQQVTARPNHEEDLSTHDFSDGDEFRNADNLELHHVSVVDGVPHEDHPIIVYKEDFVNEDYVPYKNDAKPEKHKRRYKDIGHRRLHKRQNETDVLLQEKPEKILFDIIPEKPLIVPDDMKRHRKSNIKLVPLVDEVDDVNHISNEESSLKEELHKRPKKFHRRVRRNANEKHIVHKRNPYFRHIPKAAGEVDAQVQYIYVKHSVAGKKHNGLDIPVPGRRPMPTQNPNNNDPISFENRVAADENDRVIFSSGRTTRRPTQSPTTESIFRDPRPENFDFSFMNQQRPPATTRIPNVTRRPQVLQEESIFRDPRPENFDFSFMNQGVSQNSFTPARAAPPTATINPISTGRQPATQAGISRCVWAIVNCCSTSSTEIRYACFEQNGCYGAFWGLNPCADNVRTNLVNYVADYYN